MEHGPAIAIDPSPFTAVVCSQPNCAHTNELPVVERLRDLVARSEQGVLVVGYCVLGAKLCQATASAQRGQHVPGQHVPGQHVIVQPCSTERHPIGPAVRVGPLYEAEDLDALCEWLAGGELSPKGLPARLRGAPAPLRSASRN